MKSNKTYIKPEEQPTGFESASYFQDGLAVVVRNGRTYYINKNGEDVFPSMSFEDADLFSDDFARVQVNGMKGYMNKSGEIWNGEKEIEDFLEFSEGYAFLKYKDETQWRCIDKDFKELFSFDKYEPVYPFKEGFAVIKRIKEENSEDSIWYYHFGYIPPVEQSHIDPVDADTQKNLFGEDGMDDDFLSLFSDDNEESQDPRPIEYEYNFINRAGKLLLPKWCLDAESFCEGFAVVEIDMRADDCDLGSHYGYNYINHEGDLLLEENLASAESFCEGLAAVSFEDDYNGLSFSHCYINKEGEIIMPFKPRWMPGSMPDKLGHRYNNALSFSEGVACIGWQNIDGMDGQLIDHEGNSLHDFEWDREYMLFGFKEGLAGFGEFEWLSLEKFKRVYYLNKSGEEVFTDKHFDGISPFSEGMAVVKIDNKYYYIDKEGNFLHAKC